MYFLFSDTPKNRNNEYRIQVQTSIKTEFIEKTEKNTN